VRATRRMLDPLSPISRRSFSRCSNISSRACSGARLLLGERERDDQIRGVLVQRAGGDRSAFGSHAGPPPREERIIANLVEMELVSFGNTPGGLALAPF
jgi:hypothetical protein